MKRLLIITIAIIVLITYLVIRLIIEATASLNPCKGKKLIEQGLCVAKCSEIRPYIDGRTCVPNCPINKPFIDGEYCVEKCPLDKPFLKNDIECVNTCRPGIVQFNKCLIGECTTKYTDFSTGECSDVITEGKYALGNKLVSKCPDEFHNELRECDSIGNKKWSSVAVSKDGLKIYASYKDDITGKYNMYIIREKGWKVIPDIKDEDYIGDIKISSNDVIIYRSSNNSNSFNTYKISEDNGRTFKILDIGGYNMFKDIDLDYYGVYILAIGEELVEPLYDRENFVFYLWTNRILKYNILTRELEGNITTYNLLKPILEYTYDQRDLIAANWMSGSKNTGSWRINYALGGTTYMQYIYFLINKDGNNVAVKCRIGKINGQYKFLIATKNMILITDQNLNYENNLSVPPKNTMQYVYDRMGWIYDFALNSPEKVGDWVNRYPSRNNFAKAVTDVYDQVNKNNKFISGIAWGNIEDVQISYDMSKIYVQHVFNADIYWKIFGQCRNKRLDGPGNCCICTREDQGRLENRSSEGEIWGATFNGMQISMSQINNNVDPKKLKRYVSILNINKPRPEPETYIFTETYEKINLSTTYYGNNIANFTTTQSPLINTNIIGNELIINPFTSFTSEVSNGLDNNKFKNFNNVYASKDLIRDKDGKYIVASVEDGPLYYSENFGVSWIKI